MSRVYTALGRLTSQNPICIDKSKWWLSKYGRYECSGINLEEHFDWDQVNITSVGNWRNTPVTRQPTDIHTSSFALVCFGCIQVLTGFSWFVYPHFSMLFTCTTKQTVCITSGVICHVSLVIMLVLLARYIVDISGPNLSTGLRSSSTGTDIEIAVCFTCKPSILIGVNNSYLFLSIVQQRPHVLTMTAWKAERFRPCTDKWLLSDLISKCHRTFD